MLTQTRTRLFLGGVTALSLILSACQPAAPTASGVAAQSTAVAVNTQPPATLVLVSDNPTAVPDTPTAPPTATLTATATATFTPLPTATATLLATSTPLPTATTVPATPTKKPTLKPLPTKPAATAVPTEAPVVAGGDIYGFTVGPDGYFSDIACKRNGAECTAVMPPGDVSFTLWLWSDAGMPSTHFVNYGLSVERDGVNVADAFMFVQAGWTEPGQTYRFGTSRNFSQPGTYVIRSSGCYTTVDGSDACGWNTMMGTTVTFVIQ